MSTEHTECLEKSFTVQTLNEGFHGYENWNTYAVRCAHNVCLGVVGEVDRFHEGEHEQIARLFAAAPDLLAACIEIVAWATCECGNDGIYKDSKCAVCIAEAAISKAKGETK
jgi:hypothetical protein